MYAMIVGVLLVAAKLADLGPAGAWSWWIVLSPFAVAVVWWQFSDSFGITKRREIERLEERKQERRDKALKALGLDHLRERQAQQVRDAARRRNEAPADRNEARGDAAGPRRGSGT
jgi:small Trp-rich protein